MEVELGQDDVRLCDMGVVAYGCLQETLGLIVQLLLAACCYCLPIEIPRSPLIGLQQQLFTMRGQLSCLSNVKLLTIIFSIVEVSHLSAVTKHWRERWSGTAQDSLAVLVSSCIIQTGPQEKPETGKGAVP